MANTLTTSASVASRLSDEDLDCLIHAVRMGFARFDYASDEFPPEDGCRRSVQDESIKVLRDYVRMRRSVKEIIYKYNVMVNSRVTATIDGIEYYQPFRANEVNEIKRLLAAAEKGAEDGK